MIVGSYPLEFWLSEPWPDPVQISSPPPVKLAGIHGDEEASLNEILHEPLDVSVRYSRGVEEIRYRDGLMCVPEYLYSDL